MCAVSIHTYLLFARSPPPGSGVLNAQSGRCASALPRTHASVDRLRAERRCGLYIYTDAANCPYPQSIVEDMREMMCILFFFLLSLHRFLPSPRFLSRTRRRLSSRAKFSSWLVLFLTLHRVWFGVLTIYMFFFHLEK